MSHKKKEMEAVLKNLLLDKEMQQHKHKNNIVSTTIGNKNTLNNPPHGRHHNSLSNYNSIKPGEIQLNTLSSSQEKENKVNHNITIEKYGNDVKVVKQNLNSRI